MGKRSSFERHPQDFYVTPKVAVRPLIPHLDGQVAGDGFIDTFYEPCAGDGALVRHLLDEGLGCAGASDTTPRGPGIATKDALSLTEGDVAYCDAIITNPPWARDILHPLIERLSSLRPTWLLLDSDWVHTRQAIPYMPRLRTIVSVGRLKWIPHSKMTGKDNCAWHEFVDPETHPFQATAFYGRMSPANGTDAS